jgi:hypothetical protein
MECETDHPPPSRAEVQCVELYLYSTNTPSWRGAFVKHGGNFTFSEDRELGRIDVTTDLYMNVSLKL